jgi:hypothetical protein
MKDGGTYTFSFLLTKLSAIGYTTVIFLLIGVLLTRILDMLLGKFQKDRFDPKSRISGLRLFTEIILQSFIIGVIGYMIRNIVERIPFPLDGVAGYQHSRLHELSSGSPISIVMVLFSDTIQAKISYLKKHYM